MCCFLCFLTKSIPLVSIGSLAVKNTMLSTYALPLSAPCGRSRPSAQSRTMSRY
jgi:hypothetical protein